MLNQCWKAIAIIAPLAALAGCSDPQVDPAFGSQLRDAPVATIESLIGTESERLGVSALSVSVVDGADLPRIYHFGRSHERGLMQVASLSKTVAAAVILTLAHQRGISLDNDIRSQVTSLDIALLEGGDRPVTLRQLLSHTSGASQSGYPGYPRDSDLPSASEVVANPPRFFESPLTFDGEPGEFRYSGGGYMIAQIWAEDVSGKPFAELADELLFSPLGMEDSTFAQPIDDAEIAPLFVVGADAGFNIFHGVFTPVENSWHDYPEQAAAGLWTTSKDYARFAAALLDAASGASEAIPREVASAMIMPQAEMGKGRAYGLGAMLVLDSEGSVQRVTHSGANTGYRALFAATQGSESRPRRIVVSLANTVSGEGLNKAIVDGLMDR